MNLKEEIEICGAEGRRAKLRIRFYNATGRLGVETFITGEGDATTYVPLDLAGAQLLKEALSEFLRNHLGEP